MIESGKNLIKPMSLKWKNFKEKINKLFEKDEAAALFKVKKGESALRRFATQFTTDGKSGFTPETFLDAVKNLVLKILQDKRQTKVKLILICKMQRLDLVTGETDEVDADFHSEIEENLEGTNENELYEEMN